MSGTKPAQRQRQRIAGCLIAPSSAWCSVRLSSLWVSRPRRKGRGALAESWRLGENRRRTRPITGRAVLLSAVCIGSHRDGRVRSLELARAVHSPRDAAASQDFSLTVWRARSMTRTTFRVFLVASGVGVLGTVPRQVCGQEAVIRGKVL